MNAREAKRRAYSIAAGIIEGTMGSGFDPLDHGIATDADAQRVEEALEEIVASLASRGAPSTPTGEVQP